MIVVAALQILHARLGEDKSGNALLPCCDHGRGARFCAWVPGMDFSTAITHL